VNATHKVAESVTQMQRQKVPSGRQNRRNMTSYAAAIFLAGNAARYVPKKVTAGRESDIFSQGIEFLG
jgi:hypothetical protein